MRKNLIHFLLVAVFSVCSTLAFAQTTTVRGQLVDSETGEPLIGATVMVEGTTQGGRGYRNGRRYHTRVHYRL